MLTQPIPKIVDAIPSLVASVASSLGAVNALSNRIPGGSFFKRRALSKLALRSGWVGVPIVVAGLGYWGFRAWRRANVRARQVQNRAELGQHDTTVPDNAVDESSWESFPASDPPAISPGPAPVKWPA